MDSQVMKSPTVPQKAKPKSMICPWVVCVHVSVFTVASILDLHKMNTKPKNFFSFTFFFLHFNPQLVWQNENFFNYITAIYGRSGYLAGEPLLVCLIWSQTFSQLNLKKKSNLFLGWSLQLNQSMVALLITSFSSLTPIFQFLIIWEKKMLRQHLCL